MHWCITSPFVAAVVVAFIGIGALRWFPAHQVYRAESAGTASFVEACAHLMTKEDVAAVCPSGTARDRFRVAHLVDRTADAWHCGVIVSARGIIGITMIAHVFDDETTARGRFSTEPDSSTQQWRNVLGYAEDSLFNLQRGIIPIIYAIRGRVVMDVSDPSRALCTDQQRVGLARLFYDRLPLLTEHALDQ